MLVFYPLIVTEKDGEIELFDASYKHNVKIFIPPEQALLVAHEMEKLANTIIEEQHKSQANKGGD